MKNLMDFGFGGCQELIKRCQIQNCALGEQSLVEAFGNYYSVLARSVFLGSF